jgi:hypothetical protein
MIELDVNEALLALTTLVRRADGATQAEEMQTWIAMEKARGISQTVEDRFLEKRKALGFGAPAEKKLFLMASDALADQDNQTRSEVLGWMYLMADASGGQTDGVAEGSSEWEQVSDKISPKEKYWIDNAMQTLVVKPQIMLETAKQLRRNFLK